MKPKRFKIRFWLGLAVAAIVLGVPTAAQATINVVPNPGFEEPGCGITPNGWGSVVCGWGSGYQMFRDTSYPHSGSASLHVTSCTPRWSCSNEAWASTRPVCVSIGPGSHAASFWYSDGISDGRGAARRSGGWWVSLDGSFYATPNCTGASSSNTMIEWVDPYSGWHEVTGDLWAPAGTESAFFSVVAMDQECGDCGAEAFFDDLDVEGQLTAPTGQRSR